MIDTVLAWNVGPGRRFRDLALDLRAIIHPDDDIVALFEMSTRNTRLLRVAFGVRWRVIRPRVNHRGPRRTDVVLMMRRKLPLPHIEVLSHNVSWIGPKEGIPHRGRAHIQLTSGSQRFIFVHRVPGGPRGGVNERTRGQNLKAWEADRDLIAEAVRWAGPVAVIGDQNARADELRPEYEEMGLLVHPTVTLVDHGATRGFPRARGRRLGKYGSDHPAVRWRLS